MHICAEGSMRADVQNSRVQNQHWCDACAKEIQTIERMASSETERMHLSRTSSRSGVSAIESRWPQLVSRDEWTTGANVNLQVIRSRISNWKLSPYQTLEVSHSHFIIRNSSSQTHDRQIIIFITSDEDIECHHDMSYDDLCHSYFHNSRIVNTENYHHVGDDKMYKFYS